MGWVSREERWAEKRGRWDRQAGKRGEWASREERSAGEQGPEVSRQGGTRGQASREERWASRDEGRDKGKASVTGSSCSTSHAQWPNMALLLERHSEILTVAALCTYITAAIGAKSSTPISVLV